MLIMCGDPLRGKVSCTEGHGISSPRPVYRGITVPPHWNFSGVPSSGIRDIRDLILICSYVTLERESTGHGTVVIRGYVIACGNEILVVEEGK